MTLQPTNLLNLCDDIQWKIGKEIKFKRIEEDAKKRKAFLVTYISRCASSCPDSLALADTHLAASFYPPLGVSASPRYVERTARFCNTIIKFDFEEEIHDTINDIRKTDSLFCSLMDMVKVSSILDAETLRVSYTQMKVKLQFYCILDEVECKQFFIECVDSYDPDDYDEVE